MELKNKAIGKHAFTRLYAKIREEDGGFTVNVKLQNHLKQEEAAWGQEIAASFEVASLMIGSQGILNSAGVHHYRNQDGGLPERHAALRPDSFGLAAPKQDADNRLGPSWCPDLGVSLGATDGAYLRTPLTLLWAAKSTDQYKYCPGGREKRRTRPIASLRKFGFINKGNQRAG